uniref:Protein kinase domain-containing protein n=1 Tax=Timema shepardi TaxID=629360 RepID=A0A7R9G2G2_TIMSH|nr:unnamed protein product [Timema shepardi]
MMMVCVCALLRPEVREFFQLDRRKVSSEDGSLEDDGGSDINPVNLGPSERMYAKPSDFEFLRVIGKGSFGKVLLARHKVEKLHYAVKVIFHNYIFLHTHS